MASGEFIIVQHRSLKLHRKGINCLFLNVFQWLMFADSFVVCGRFESKKPCYVTWYNFFNVVQTYLLATVPCCFSLQFWRVFFWKLLNVPVLLCGLTIRCHLRHAASTRLMTTDNIILTSWYLKTIQNQNVLTKISMKAPCKLSKYLIKSS